MKTKQIIKDEIIGLHVKIDGHEGIIIDETKNMLYVKTKNEIKRFQKKKHNFEIHYKKQWLIIDGKKIAWKPEERIKRIIK